MVKLILSLFFLQCTSAYAEEYKYYSSYAFINQNTATSNSASSEFTNPKDSGISITSGRIVENDSHFEFEFSYLGDMGFTYGDYITYQRYITLVGLNLIKNWDFLSFGTGFGLMRIDNHITKTKESGITITEELRSGIGYYSYFKFLLEAHYRKNRFELFTNFTNYYWFQEDGKISINDNGTEKQKTLTIFQSARSINIGLRYYFN
jgi:hypothetical protein